MGVQAVTTDIHLPRRVGTALECAHDSELDTRDFAELVDEALVA